MKTIHIHFQKHKLINFIQNLTNIQQTMEKAQALKKKAHKVHQNKNSKNLLTA